MKSRTRPNLIKCLEICRNTCLFRQLRTLRKVHHCIEIIHIEDARDALGSGTLKFRRNESEVIDVRAGIFADESLNAVCYLVCRCLEDGR